MGTYRVTFGCQYPREPHPTFKDAHADGWVEIEADDELTARRIAVRYLGTAWSNIYDEGSWDDHWFPLGCLAVLGDSSGMGRTARAAGEGGQMTRGDDPMWGCRAPGCDVHPANPDNGGPIFRISPKGAPFEGLCEKHSQEWVSSPSRQEEW